MKAILVREIVEVAYSGDNSTKFHQSVEVEIQFNSPDGKEPKITNPTYSHIGTWIVLKPVVGGKDAAPVIADT